MLLALTLLLSHIQIDSTFQDSVVFKMQELEQINISAYRTSTLDIETGNAINKLTATDIKNNLSRSTPEALQFCAPVFIQKTNHGGGSPIIRGLMGNQTLLIIDGIRLNNSTYRYGPNQYLNTVDPFSLNKIEILSGSGSVQYGSDALGGVIHLFTADPTLNTGFGATILGRLTSQNMEKTGRAEINYGSKKISGLASFSIRNFGDLHGGKNTGRQVPSGYGEDAGNVKINYTLKKSTFIFSNQYYHGHQIPITHKIKLENFKINEINHQKRNLTYAKHGWQNNSKWINELNTTISFQQSQENRESQKINSSLNITEFDQVQSYTINSSFTSLLSTSWKANTGIEMYKDYIKSNKQSTNIETSISEPGRGLYPDKSTFTSYSIFTIHQLSFKPFILSGGLRFNVINIRIHEPSVGKKQIIPKAFVYNINTGYKISKFSTVFVSLNSGYRAPNIDDMGTLGIVDFRYEIPAFDLKPEGSQSLELGLKISESKLKWMISMYSNHISNLITRVKLPDQFIAGYPVYRKENIGKAVLKGFENSFYYSFNKNIELNALLTYTDGKNKITNEPMRRIPPLFGRIGARYILKQFFLKTEFAFAGHKTKLAKADIEDNRIGINGTPGWNVFNLFAGLQFRLMEVQLGVNNLGNIDYKTHGSGVYGQGRSLTLQLQYHFNKSSQ